MTLDQHASELGVHTRWDRAAVSPAATPIRVLVVDDDPFFVLAATALPEAEGMQVVGSAPNGAQALVAAALRPDVVTLDIDMPIMDGIVAAQRLRQDNQNVPIVLVSGSESDARVAAARASGAAAHVDKLSIATELAEVVRAAAVSTRPSTAGIAVRNTPSDPLVRAWLRQARRG